MKKFNFSKFFKNFDENFPKKETETFEELLRPL